MDQQTVEYLLKYFSHRLPDQERLLLRHIQSTEKLRGVVDAATGQRMQLAYQRLGWLVTDKQVLVKLADGPEAFQYNAAVALFNTQGRERLLNLCPRCAQLARTPHARQCRYCGQDWHEE